MCNLRIACNTRRKNASTGEWEDKPNYFNVTVWGAQGENAARYLSKGRPVAIDGRLEWREWEAQDGTKRQAVDIIADSVQFLGGRDDARRRVASPAAGPPRAATSRSTKAISSPHRSPAQPATTTFRSSQYSEVSVLATEHAQAPSAHEGTRWPKHADGKPVRRRDKKGGPAAGGASRASTAETRSSRSTTRTCPSLRRFISEKGKIRSRRITGACRRHQVQIARAVKRARELALLPYVNEGGRDDSPRRDRVATGTASARRGGWQCPRRSCSRTSRRSASRAAVVDVSKGYLRNYLIPRKLAEPATTGAIEAVRQRQAAAERAAREAVEKAQENAALLGRTVLTIPQQAGDDGRLFGSVTAQDIADAIREARGLRIDSAGVHLDEPIKNVGTYMVVVEVVDGRDRDDQDDGRRQEVAAARTRRPA